MGYDVHITRKQDWADTEGPCISEDEWGDCVDADPELSWDKDGNLHDAKWNDKDQTPFWFHEGDIYTKNPSPVVLKKMFAVATVLNAVVQGDDGELYDENGEVFQSPPIVTSKSRPRRKGGIFLFLMLLAPAIICLGILGWFIVSTIMVLIFGEEYYFSYNTIAEARADEMINRGWIPGNLPDSTRNIELEYNIDSNKGKVTFHLDAPVWDGFVQTLEHDDKGRAVYRDAYHRTDYVFEYDAKNQTVECTY